MVICYLFAFGTPCFLTNKLASNGLVYWSVALWSIIDIMYKYGSSTLNSCYVQVWLEDTQLILCLWTLTDSSTFIFDCFFQRLWELHLQECGGIVVSICRSSPDSPHLPLIYNYSQLSCVKIKIIYCFVFMYVFLFVCFVYLLLQADEMGLGKTVQVHQHHIFTILSVIVWLLQMSVFLAGLHYSAKNGPDCLLGLFLKFSFYSAFSCKVFSS